MQTSSGGVSSTLEEIMEKCFGFIEANTKDVFQSDHFLELPKELLVAIVSSSKVTGCKYAIEYLVMLDACYVNPSLKSFSRVYKDRYNRMGCIG